MRKTPCIEGAVRTRSLALPHPTNKPMLPSHRIPNRVPREPSRTVGGGDQAPRADAGTPLSTLLEELAELQIKLGHRFRVVVAGAGQRSIGLASSFEQPRAIWTQQAGQESAADV